jgi:hypothetical protein
MVLTSTVAESSASQRTLKGGAVVRTELIGTSAEAGSSPSVHLAACEPGYVIDPHFHQVDQYQLFVGGSGRIGKHEVRAGVFHYAARQTPYGPIVAGDQGIEFLTLRPHTVPGAYYMPGSKHLMDGRAGRSFVVSIDLDEPRATRSSRLEEHPDGVAGYALAAAPGDPLPQPAVPSGGAYYVVLAGEVSIDDKPCPERSCCWVGAEDRAPVMIAGPEGAVVAFMSFAREVADPAST